MIPTELIAHPGARVRIGARTMFNYGARLEAYAAVDLAPGCFLGSRVVLCDRGPDGVVAPITIEEGVWLAHGAVVCPGVRVGARSIVAAGAVVTRDIPPDSIAAGNPARPMPLRMIGGDAASGA
jgi:maltose O-acetyltransferase